MKDDADQDVARYRGSVRKLESRHNAGGRFIHATVDQTASWAVVTGMEQETIVTIPETWGASVCIFFFFLVSSGTHMHARRIEPRRVQMLLFERRRRVAKSNYCARDHA